MPSQGYTVSPVYSDDSSEQQVVDFEVSTRPRGVNRDGTYEGWQDDYFEDQQGNSHHRFEEVILDEDDPHMFNDQEYIEALFDVNPALHDALVWADGNLDAEFVEYLNREFNSNDPDKMNPAIELLLEQYYEFAENPHDNELPEEDTEVDELTEEETQILSEAVEMLEGQTADAYLADSWNSAVTQAKDAGDLTYATVAAATASFHEGSLTAEEAIDYCLNHCDLKDLSRVYKHLLDN